MAPGTGLAAKEPSSLHLDVGAGGRLALWVGQLPDRPPLPRDVSA